ISSHQRLGSNAVIVQDRVSFRSDRAALTVFDQEAQAKIPITEGVRYTCCPVWIEIGDELGDAACNFGKAIGPYDYAALLIPHETPRINITERLPFFDDEVTEETRRCEVDPRAIVRNPVYHIAVQAKIQIEVPIEVCLPNRSGGEQRFDTLVFHVAAVGIIFPGTGAYRQRNGEQLIVGVGFVNRQVDPEPILQKSQIQTYFR